MDDDGEFDTHFSLAIVIKENEISQCEFDSTIQNPSAEDVDTRD